MSRRRDSRKPQSPLDISDPRFEGSAYSNQELAFLMEHFGENAMQAMPPEEDLPEGVNELAVGPLLDRTFALDAFQHILRDRHKDDTIRIWAGFEALRAVCQQTLEWNDTVKELKRRSRGASAEIRRAASCPSLHMWDPTTDQPSLYGVGADTDRVLTALTSDGRRVELFTELQSMGVGSIKSLGGVASFLKKTSVPVSDRILATTPETLEFAETEDNGICACPLCGKAETYKVSQSASKRKAVALIMKHLHEENVSKIEQHRLLAKRLKSGKGSSKSRVSALDMVSAED